MVATHDSPVTAPRLALIALIWLFLSVPAGAQSTGTIRGKVVDKRTGEALLFVNVVIRGTSFGASTNSEGVYAIEKVPPGLYTLGATLVGHEPRVVPDITVESGAAVVVNIEMADASVEIGDVTVFGASLRGEKITDAPAAVSVLEPADIKLSAVSGQLPKLLENQAGVDIAQSGINDFNVNTRGFNSSLNRRLLVLLDGRDLSVAFLGSQEWNGLSVPVEDLGKIELIRGPGSALYGANAFNGVINILTPRPRDIVGGKVTIAGGEKNTLRTDVRYAGFSGPWSYKGNIGRFQGDTWSVSRRTLPFEYPGFNPFLNAEVVDVDRAKVSSTYGSGRVDYQFDGGETATIEGGSTQVENEILVTGIGRVQVPKAVKPWGRASYSSENVFVQLWAAGRNSIDPQISLSTGLPLEEKSFMGQADVQYRFSVLEERLAIVLGAAHKYQFVDTEGTLTLASHHDNLSGFYAQLEYKVSEQIKAIAAGRLDRSTLHTSQFSPKLAMVWTPVVGHSIRATFNKAFQAPNYSEMFLNVKHPVRNLVYFGNEDLIVERITGYEVGYKGVFENMVFLTMDGYYNQLRDFITDLAPNVNPRYPGQIVLPGETITRTVWSYGNAGRVNEYGFELGVNYYASPAVQFTASYAYFGFEVKEKNANDVLLPNAPEHKVNAGVTFRHEALEAGVSAKVVPGYDWAAGIYKGPILAYTLVNMNASYQLTGLIGLGLNVTNLLDREHYQIFGGSLIGRRVVLGMTASF